jgi:cell division transport system permease protein
MGKSSAKTKPQRLKGDGFFSQHVKQAKLAYRDLLSRPIGNLLTLAIIAMSLALPASLYLVGKNLTMVAAAWQAPSQISLYLVESSNETKALALQADLEQWPEIEGVVYISPQQGLEEFSQHSGFVSALSLLDDNPLPTVLIVTPHTEWQQRSKVKELNGRLIMEPLVDDIRIDDDWLARLQALKHVAVTVGLVLASLMLVAVFLIVGNTLRFNVLEHKEEIQVMKLVGATDRFILRPYLYTGFWFGLLGGTAAWILTAIMTLVVNGAVAELAILYESRFRLIGLTWDESLLLLMVASFLGVMAAQLSAMRHLKEIEPI